MGFTKEWDAFITEKVRAKKFGLNAWAKRKFFLDMFLI